MPIIEPEDKSLKALTGVHLWHAGLSSCSQRVRIAFAEKKQAFVSHLIDLAAGENASPDYQRVHPKGLVPAIVIDGDLIIESIDIIEEIDMRFSMHSLRPKENRGQREMYDIMKRADDAQPSLKLLTFEFLFRAAPPPSRDIMESFQKNHRNEALKEFHRDFASGFDHERINAAVNACHEDFLWLEKLLLDRRPYLAGDDFSLADIAWMPNVHRFSLIGWPFHRYPYLQRWFERVSLRQSYRQGLVDWEPKELIDSVAPKIKQRIESGDGVEAYGALNKETGKEASPA